MPAFSCNSYWRRAANALTCASGFAFGSAVPAVTEDLAVGVTVGFEAGVAAATDCFAALVGGLVEGGGAGLVLVLGSGLGEACAVTVGAFVAGAVFSGTGVVL